MTTGKPTRKMLREILVGFTACSCIEIDRGMEVTVASQDAADRVVHLVTQRYGLTVPTIIGPADAVSPRTIRIFGFPRKRREPVPPTLRQILDQIHTVAQAEGLDVVVRLADEGLRTIEGRTA